MVEYLLFRVVRTMVQQGKLRDMKMRRVFQLVWECHGPRVHTTYMRTQHVHKTTCGSSRAPARSTEPPCLTHQYLCNLRKDSNSFMKYPLYMSGSRALRKNEGECSNLIPDQDHVKLL